MLILFILMIGNLGRLVRDYRAHVPGAKLKARIVTMFVGLAALPLLVVFYFSMQFINSPAISKLNCLSSSRIQVGLVTFISVK